MWEVYYALFAKFFFEGILIKLHFYPSLFGRLETLYLTDTFLDKNQNSWWEGNLTEIVTLKITWRRGLIVATITVLKTSQM